MSSLFARKAISELLAEGENPSGLRRELGVGDLVMLSIGAVIGAGIFSTLCYAELAAMIPQAGSAYAYSYATMGELIAWIIGWDLILEYAVGNVAVAISWAGYFNSLISPWIQLPPWLTHGYWNARALAANGDAAMQALLADPPRVAGIPVLVNLPA